MIHRTCFSLLISLLLMMPTSIQALEFPERKGSVVDQAGLLSAGQVQQLSTLLKNHEKLRANQVMVVTLRSLQGETIEGFGVALGTYWGVGNKDKDNGVLLIVAPNERKVRIEVGYGLEGVLTDIQSNLIIQEHIIPQFKQGKYGAGTVIGAQKIIDVLNEMPLSPATDNKIGSNIFSNFGELWFYVLGFLFYCLHKLFDSIFKGYRDVVYKRLGVSLLAAVILAATAFWFIRNTVLAGVVGLVVFCIYAVKWQSLVSKSNNKSCNNTEHSEKNQITSDMPLAMKRGISLDSSNEGDRRDGGRFGGGGASGGW